MFNRFFAVFGTLFLTACAGAPTKVDDETANAAFAAFMNARPSYLMDPEKGPSYRVEYATIARQSAVVETWRHAKGRIEVTVFFKDRHALMATHYCGSGIQSTMRLAPMRADGVFEFKIVSATNLADPRVAHNSGFAYRFLPNGRIERRETWTENGVVSEEWNTLHPAD